MFKNIANNKSILLLIIFILLYIPVLFSRTDMWDGVILDHAISLGRSDVYHEWFSEAGLYLTAFFYDPLAFLKEFYPFSGQILTLFFLYFSALEITRLSETIYKISEKESTLVGIFYLLLPLWSTFFFDNLFDAFSYNFHSSVKCKVGDMQSLSIAHDNINSSYVSASINGTPYSFDLYAIRDRE
ncbi:hypothetical protein NFB42_13880 [Yersinia ruckeri]|uniref:hypothetical protein n=1 Tax=Yersinia ruckeri TaxID=29486 RepID=UPI0022372348|nr:hypothetical protein [Yersinia ruckeri]MCW6528056.1 hypothetical protein [Yersinia ruckeri]